MSFLWIDCSVWTSCTRFLYLWSKPKCFIFHSDRLDLTSIEWGSNRLWLYCFTLSHSQFLLLLRLSSLACVFLPLCHRLFACFTCSAVQYFFSVVFIFDILRMIFSFGFKCFVTTFFLLSNVDLHVCVRLYLPSHLSSINGIVNR